VQIRITQPAPPGFRFAPDAFADQVGGRVALIINGATLTVSQGEAELLSAEVTENGGRLTLLVELADQRLMPPAEHHLQVLVAHQHLEVAVELPGPDGGSDPVLDAPVPWDWMHDYGLDGRPIDAQTAELLMHSYQRRRVGEDTVQTGDGPVRVVTSFMVSDYAFGGGPPLLWETLIDGGPLDGRLLRWGTRADAEEGHRGLVEAMRSPDAVAVMVEWFGTADAKRVKPEPAGEVRREL
jgi:hypothetical protein